MTIDYQVLREAAEKATPDEWVAFISTDTGTYAVHTPGDERCEDVIKWTGFDGQKNAENNARHVAAFNPKVALELLGEIKCLEDTNIDATCRISELETNLAALVAENAGLKHAMAVTLEHVSVTDAGQAGVAAMIINDALHHSETPATDAFLAEVRTEARKEGAYFVANRMLAAWEAGFIDDTAKNAADIARMILTSTEFMANAPEGDFDRSFSDGVLEDIAAQLRKGGNQ
ncbi:ead/Ea22-like family protein [Escherichia coli]|uniref:ead/Ea22-like family protein n=1 Tax=Enterobacteriaceae TaxID=543 RepID=UPI0003EF0669|nr:ead/Ea22-like family protein [Escherichia coli]EEZ8897319.1 ead/Ea22-like family protein [Escherichia coli O104]EFQ0070421.1 ead/Ea22-like family protein [Shigella flexneri]EIB1121984.1 ead/Ea22-like family protein [Salmonella enterica]EIT7032721.1 ead/Ea22-like family protein [Salmonella enterica subsp. enterica serovar Virchow]MCL9494824.1 ead/Ea22-like family protein [Salmonella enterica subsp. enterica serovar Enteritidis]HBN3017033.1 ead/Ea22-like family protein [Escherichia coli O25b